MEGSAFHRSCSVVASCVVFVLLNMFCIFFIDEIAAGFMGSYYSHSPVVLTSALGFGGVMMSESVLPTLEQHAGVFCLSGS